MSARDLGDRDVILVDVGPRDGLQNEPQTVSTAVKCELIARLEAAGLREIEATAFVSPRWVPQMADHEEVLRQALAASRATTRLSVLVPNMKGFELAARSGAREVAVFTAASETFAQRNINCSIAESLERFAPVFTAARGQGIAVRAYVSCAVHCPYGGQIAPEAVADVAARLHDFGACEISLGETTGKATPPEVLHMLERVAGRVPVSNLAGHFHDTYGMGIANLHAAYEFGLRVFDASVGGLGGCPYAPGAGGNIATEDAVWLFQGMGLKTGIDLAPLVASARWISAQLNREASSRVARACRPDSSSKLESQVVRLRDSNILHKTLK